MARAEKRHYQVTIYQRDCQHRDCTNGCIGHDCLGLGVIDTTYTYKEAKDLLADWKRDIHAIKGVLTLDGTPIEQWERVGRAWPETVKIDMTYAQVADLWQAGKITDTQLCDGARTVQPEEKER